MSFHILIVDDEPDLEQLIKQKFRKEILWNQLEFYSAYNGLEALNILQKNGQIDLVLTDINMPRMDGLTLLEKIRAMKNPVLKTVIVSAYGDMENIRRAMNLGAFDFITKPINFKDLEITIQKTLDEIRNTKLSLETQNKLMIIQNELDIARDIQMSILPTTKTFSVELQNFELDVEMITAGEVGGDFYDYFMINDTLLGIVIGDVAGKGIPASIFMALCKTAIKAIALNENSVVDCFKAVNNTLIDECMNDLFVTAFYAILDIRTGHLKYCNAGHNPTYIRRTDGEVKPLPEVNGIPLGFRKNYPFSAGNMKLTHGDILFMHTDGVNETLNEQHDEFSEERIMHYLTMFTNGGTMPSLNQFILEAISSFKGINPQVDDLTVFSLKYLEPNVVKNG